MKTKNQAKRVIPVNLDVKVLCFDGYANERILDPDFTTPELDNPSHRDTNEFMDLYSMEMRRLVGQDD